MNTPLADMVTAQSQTAVRFCMPGHKGTLDKQDITEAGGMDTLLDPAGPVAEAQTLLARAYGAKVGLFGTCGSSLGIFAMLFSALCPQDLVLMAGDCHISALHAALARKARVSLLAIREQDGLPRPLSVQTLQEALERAPEAKAVYVTSPNYYGFCADIEGLAALCHRQGLPLLVDGAHGAHFGFAPRLPKQPVQADAWVVSAHKTLSVPNQGALGFLGQGSLLSSARFIQNWGMFHTTSPSWPLLAAMDRARATLEQRGPALYEGLYRRLAAFIKTLPAGYTLMGGTPADHDFSRAVLKVPGDQNGKALLSYLLSQNIWVELADPRHLVLITTPEDPPAWFSALSNALAKAPLYGGVPACPAPPLDPQPFSPDAVEYGTISYLPFAKALGQRCARALYGYPPGIPVCCPGQLFTKEQLQYIQQALRSGYEIKGLQWDGTHPLVPVIKI